MDWLIWSIIIALSVAVLIMIRKNYQIKKEAELFINFLLDPENVYSLDTLNGYIHSSKTYAINRQLVNGFWDFLLPMFQELLDIKEEEN